MTGFDSRGRRVRARRTVGTVKAIRTARKALKIANKNIDMVNASVEADNLDLPLTAAPAVEYLQPAGTRERCTYDSLTGRIWIRRAQASTDIDSWRCDIVLDRQPNGVVLDVLKVYDDATPQITALLNFNERDRYKIVKSYTGSFAINGNSVSRSISFKLKTGLICESITNSFAQNEIQKNAYYLVYWTESTVNVPSISYNIDTLVTN